VAIPITAYTPKPAKALAAPAPTPVKDEAPNLPYSLNAVLLHSL